MTEQEIIYQVRGCAFNVRNELGRFLHEHPYQMAMEYALRQAGLEAYREVPINVVFDGYDCGKGYSVDILIVPDIVIELKAAPEMLDIHYAQVRNYMNLLHSPFGMLINFGVKDFRDGIHVLRANPKQFPKSKAFPMLESKK
ncbi:MAG: GxxExxY protein [Bacteroides sp.]|nr:GxxExxY protein [Bacteroides sp.]MCM1457317.1 GxxExxY protein [Lachnoclostridium sp.]